MSTKPIISSITDNDFHGDDGDLRDDAPLSAADPLGERPQGAARHRQEV